MSCCILERETMSLEEGIVGMLKRALPWAGGLIRSLGGWDEGKKMRLKGQDRITSDQRILGKA